MINSSLIGKAALKSTEVGGIRLLNLAFTSSGVIGNTTFCMGLHNIAVADSGDFGYLCIFRDLSATPVLFPNMIHGENYKMASSGEDFCLVANPIGNSTPTQSIVIGNVALACNVTGDLIVHDASASIGTPDEEGIVHLGTTALRVVRKGDNWFFCITT